MLRVVVVAKYRVFGVFFAVIFILIPVKMLESKILRDTWYLPEEAVRTYAYYLACAMLAAVYSIGNFIFRNRAGPVHDTL